MRRLTMATRLVAAACLLSSPWLCACSSPRAVGVGAEGPPAFAAEPPVLVYAPSAGPPRRALAAGGVQIAWTTDHFAVLFAEK